jgi:predicted nicotinamide N-methyase
LSFTYPYETAVEEISLSGHKLNLEKLKSLDETIDGFFALYEKTGREELFEDLCPYFGVPWPAGTALAERAVKEAPRWAGKRILELACGLALPTLVLAKIGGAAELTASDLHPDVPEFFRRNLAHNKISARYRPLDWRTDTSSADVILGSDLVYDRRQPAALLSFLERATWQEVLLADPNRPYWDSFVAAAKALPHHTEEFREGAVRFLAIRRRP